MFLGTKVAPRRMEDGIDGTNSVELDHLFLNCLFFLDFSKMADKVDQNQFFTFLILNHYRLVAIYGTHISSIIRSPV